MGHSIVMYDVGFYKNKSRSNIFTERAMMLANNSENLQDEVRLFEPRIALDGGCDGLDFYRNIANQSRKFLKNKGSIFLEIGYNQSQEVVDIFEKSNFKFINSAKDLSGIIRVLEFEKI